MISTLTRHQDGLKFNALFDLKGFPFYRPETCMVLSHACCTFCKAYLDSVEMVKCISLNREVKH
jgi:hypothetical protein